MLTKREQLPENSGCIIVILCFVDHENHFIKLNGDASTGTENRLKIFMTFLHRQMVRLGIDGVRNGKQRCGTGTPTVTANI